MAHNKCNTKYNNLKIKNFQNSPVCKLLAIQGARFNGKSPLQRKVLSVYIDFITQLKEKRICEVYILSHVDDVSLPRISLIQWFSRL